MILFRKKFNIGPLRINLSKSGIGFSIGSKGFRIGVDSKKKKYVSLSKDGVSYRKYVKKSRANKDTWKSAPQGEE